MEVTLKIYILAFCMLICLPCYQLLVPCTSNSPSDVSCYPASANSQFGPCSAECGPGSQSRPVVCRSFKTDNTYYNLRLCRGSETQVCEGINCPPECEECQPPMHGETVCGDDGVIYGDECAMNKAACEQDIAIISVDLSMCQ